jgi:uncharacterized membrane protein YcaP (DUF421 family)
VRATGPHGVCLVSLLSERGQDACQTSDLNIIFGTMQHVTWWQECLRAIVVFGYGLLLVRLTGRRTFGRWSAPDIVISIILGSSLSRAVTGSAPFAGTMGAMAILMGLHWVLGRVVAASPKWSALLEGIPVVLARKGTRDDKAMLTFSVSRSDLEESLRGAGVQNLADAGVVTLEPSGKITVVKR